MCVFVEHRRKSEGPALEALLTNACLLTRWFIEQVGKADKPVHGDLHKNGCE